MQSAITRKIFFNMKNKKKKLNMENVGKFTLAV